MSIVDIVCFHPKKKNEKTGEQAEALCSICLGGKDGVDSFGFTVSTVESRTRHDF